MITSLRVLVPLMWKHLVPGTRGLHTGQQPLLRPRPPHHGFIAAARHQVQGELWQY